MYYTYILTNKWNNVLYTGSCADLQLRVFQHFKKLVENSFTARYNCSKLVWYQEFENYNDAFSMERRLKNWQRSWKVELIEKDNPDWENLASDWDFSGYLG